MERQNYIVKIRMDDSESHAFANLTPLINLAITENEGNLVARLLGYKHARDLFKNGFRSNPFLKNAFLTIGFLYLSRDDKSTFDDFWDRLLFTDKQVENKCKRTFNIPDEDDVLSTTQLELMWLLQTDRDELDERHLD